MNNFYETHDSNMKKPESASVIRKLAGVLALLTFIADMLLLLILIGTLLEFGLLSSAQPIPIQFLLILIIYLFGIGLFIYGRPAFGDMFDGLIYIFFAWPYILLAAGLLSVVALRFVTSLYLDFGFLEFILYAFAITVISMFGVLLSRIVNESVKYFAVPFLLVTLWQIYLWVWRVLSDKGIPAGWNLIGSLFLFVFAVVFIIILLRETEAPDNEFD